MRSFLLMMLNAIAFVVAMIAGGLVAVETTNSTTPAPPAPAPPIRVIPPATTITVGNGKTAREHGRVREANDDSIECVLTTVHKFGFVLTLGLRDKRYSKCDFHGVGFTSRLRKLNLKQPNIPILFVARNVYEAIVSGYLYHKKGEECNSFDDRTWGRIPLDLFESVVTHAPYRSLFRGPTNSSVNLCDTLASAPMEAGVGIYAQWIMSDKYRETLLFFRDLKSTKDGSSSSTTPGTSSVKVVCHELLATDIINEADRFLNGFDDNVDNDDFLIEKKYSGVHSTSQDQSLRAEIRDIVYSIDTEILDGELAEMQDLFGCRDALFSV